MLGDNYFMFFTYPAQPVSATFSNNFGTHGTGPDAS